MTEVPTWYASTYVDGVVEEEVGGEDSDFVDLAFERQAERAVRR